MYSIDLNTAAEILWPILHMWADTRPVHDPITIPSIDVLTEYSLYYAELDDSKLGSFSVREKTICIDTCLNRHILMTTLLHELVHLVQYEDNAGNFSRHYNLMDNRFGYTANPYEKEACRSASIYHNCLFNNTDFAAIVAALFKGETNEGID